MERWIKLREMRLGIKIPNRLGLQLPSRAQSVDFREYRQKKPSARSLPTKNSPSRSLVARRMKYHPTRRRTDDPAQQRNLSTRQCLTSCENGVQDESLICQLSKIHILKRAKARRRRCLGIRKLCYRNRYPKKVRRRPGKARATRRGR
ncbi:uncharacterized protein LOC124356208 [Homalodisca vitripennis]|uniref:uncharacterized protein LOC124356208 n=1 Tax=Homalodisca vitripennis TaxID=197043 RepID=UPI001EEA34E2|nr:uncharacterized protein LOC124356208 [Homalodisca vitripennis]